MWYLSENVAIARIQKAGLMTMNAWLRGFELVRNDDPHLLQCPVRVAFIRNPLARLQSSYSFFKGMDAGGTRHNCPAPRETWEEYVDYILENENEHWIPQARHTGNLQTITHRFEDFDNLFFRYHSHPKTHENKSAPYPVNAYRLTDIVEYYREDFESWMGASY